MNGTRILDPHLPRSSSKTTLNAYERSFRKKNGRGAERAIFAGVSLAVRRIGGRLRRIPVFRARKLASMGVEHRIRNIEQQLGKGFPGP